MAIKACLTVRCNSTTPTLAKSRIPGDEGTQYGIRGSTATSVYWTTMGISIRPIRAIARSAKLGQIVHWSRI